MSGSASEASLNLSGPTLFQSPAGVLARHAPRYVLDPPIEAVVFAWGVNEDGQLGMEGMQDVPIPKVVDTLLGLQFSGRSFLRTPLVAGSRNTLAIDSQGGVWSWGWNDRGTLGHGHRSAERKPKRIQALKGVRVVQAAIGGWHCLALSDNGQVYAWGGNEYRQCGVDSHDQRDMVTPVPVSILPKVRVCQVACGGMHSLVLAEDGSVYTWGEPWGDFSMKPERKIRQVPGADGIVSIACGAFHNMALTYRGEVLTWGTNDYGQLGNGNTSYCTEPRRVVDMDHVLVSDIAAGGWHSAALSTAGEVYIWGRGEYGRLGLGDRSGSSRLRPQRLRGLEGHVVVQVVCGGTHTVALSDRGRMFIWGRGSFGRLGLGSSKDLYTPVEMLLPGGSERWRVLAIAAGGRHSLALAMPMRESLQGDAIAELDRPAGNGTRPGFTMASLAAATGDSLPALPLPMSAIRAMVQANGGVGVEGPVPLMGLSPVAGSPAGVAAGRQNGAGPSPAAAHGSPNGGSWSATQDAAEQAAYDGGDEANDGGYEEEDEDDEDNDNEEDQEDVGQVASGGGEAAGRVVDLDDVAGAYDDVRIIRTASSRRGSAAGGGSSPLMARGAAGAARAGAGSPGGGDAAAPPREAAYQTYVIQATAQPGAPVLQSHLVDNPLFSQQQQLLLRNQQHQQPSSSGTTTDIPADGSSGLDEMPSFDSMSAMLGPATTTTAARPASPPAATAAGPSGHAANGQPGSTAQGISIPAGHAGSGGSGAVLSAAPGSLAAEDAADEEVARAAGAAGGGGGGEDGAGSFSHSRARRSMGAVRRVEDVAVPSPVMGSSPSRSASPAPPPQGSFPSSFAAAATQMLEELGSAGSGHGALGGLGAAPVTGGGDDDDDAPSGDDQLVYGVSEVEPEADDDDSDEQQTLPMRSRSPGLPLSPRATPRSPVVGSPAGRTASVSLGTSPANHGLSRARQMSNALPPGFPV